MNNDERNRLDPSREVKMATMGTYRDELERLLAPTSEALREQVRLRYEAITCGRENRFVLFGTGFLGKAVLKGLRSLGIEPLAFCDNNPRLKGTDVQGLMVLSPDEAVRRYRDEAIFIPSVFTTGPLLAQMEALHMRVLPVPELFWQHSEALLPFSSLALPHEILDHKDEVRQGLALWDEDASREEYLAQIAWRTTLERKVLPPCLPQGEIYFPADLVELNAEEVFVDCGAFDGDSLRALLDRVPSVQRFIGIEPDSRNRIQLQACIDGLSEELRSRCSALPYAVSDHAGTIRFRETGTAGSNMTEAGDQEIPAERLDVLLQDVVPTFIKMDIEGAEPLALEGGRHVIKRSLPILAICLYHRPSDLWEIPKLIRDIAPEYRLFLRRYCDDCWEQVCYAIPSHRLKR